MVRVEQEDRKARALRRGDDTKSVLDSNFGINLTDRPAAALWVKFDVSSPQTNICLPKQNQLIVQVLSSTEVGLIFYEDSTNYRSFVYTIPGGHDHTAWNNYIFQFNSFGVDPIIKINNVTLSKASGPTDTNSPSAYLNVPDFTMMGLDFTNIAFDGAISNVMTFGNTTTNPLDTARIYADRDGTTSGMGNLLSFLLLVNLN